MGPLATEMYTSTPRCTLPRLLCYVACLVRSNNHANIEFILGLAEWLSQEESDILHAVELSS